MCATVRSANCREPVEALGAKVIAPEGFAEHGPFDVILELVGAPNLPEDIMALAMRGRIAVIGIGAGAKAEVNLGLLLGKRAQIHASMLRARPLEDKALTARAMESEVLPLFVGGGLSVPLAASFPLEEAQAAYERFGQGGKFGKIILTM